MAFQTIRDQLHVAASLHRRLHHRYVTLASLAVSPVREMLELLAEQEDTLARGLDGYASCPDRALDTWIQYPTRPAGLTTFDDLETAELPALAAAWDAEMAEVYRPLRGSSLARVQALCQSLDEVREARARARARLVTIGL